MFRIFLISLTLVGCSPALQAHPMPETTEQKVTWPGTVTVTGQSTIMLVPDVVTFSVGVQTLAETARAAVEENNARTQAVLDALRRAGAEPDELQTRNFSVWPQMHYDEAGRRPRIEGYMVSNEIVVRKEDPTAASRLLQAAIDAGANTGGGLSFVVSDPSAGNQKGLVAAFNDAKMKASTLAAASGRSLGKVVSLAEGIISNQVPTPVPVMREMAMGGDASVPIESGREQKTYQVTVVFELD